MVLIYLDVIRLKLRYKIGYYESLGIIESCLYWYIIYIDDVFIFGDFVIFFLND